MWCSEPSRTRPPGRPRRYGRSSFALAATLVLAGCGFEPIAAPNGAGLVTTADQVIAFGRVSIGFRGGRADTERFAYRLRRALDAEARLDSPGQPDLRVLVTLGRRNLAISSDDDITRRNFNARATFEFTDPAASADEETDAALTAEEKLEAILLSGSVESTSAVNTTSDLFSTEVAEREALDRLAEDLARQIITRARLLNANVARN